MDIFQWRDSSLVGPGSHSLLLASLSLAVVALTSLVVFRLFFHLLANVPGPAIAAITDYYVTYYDLAKDGNMVKQLERLHRHYGKPLQLPSLIYV